VAFAPASGRCARLMQGVAALNGLEFGTDVVGFDSNSSLKTFVSKNLGRVQFSVFFVEEELWSLNSDAYSDAAKNATADAAQTSYVIFSNYSANDKDPRSDKSGVYFPLLTLQKSIDHSILLAASDDPASVVYEARYGTVWSFAPSDQVSAVGALNSTDCDLDQRDFSDLATAASWVFPFAQTTIGIIAFQLVTEERSKQLFSMLRRLGLYDSVYWGSWFMSFLMLNIAGAAIAVFFAAVLRSEVYAFRHIDYGVIFVLLLVGNQCSTCMGFFLASVSNTSSASTAVVLTVFITLVFTIAFCSTPLNEYSYDYYFDEDLGRYFRACVLTTSSYNTIYSTKLLASGFVQFLVFFMPWFHIAQAVTDVLSVVQYDGETFEFGDLHASRQSLSYSGTKSSEYDSQWAEWSLGMMLASGAVFLFLAWFCGLALTSDVSEGRSLTTIFFPSRLRKLLSGAGLAPAPRLRVLEGDVRGLEQQRSLRERSIRGYKVSVFECVCGGGERERERERCVSMPCVRPCAISIYMCVRIHIYMHIHIHIYIRIPVLTHTPTHTPTHTSTPTPTHRPGVQDVQLRAGPQGDQLHHERGRGICHTGTQR
jgi:hypothetical protein